MDNSTKIIKSHTSPPPFFTFLFFKVSTSTLPTDTQSIEPETLLHAQFVESVQIRSQKGIAAVDALVLPSRLDPGEYCFAVSDNTTPGDEGETGFGMYKELEVLGELGLGHLPFLIKA